MVLGRMKRNDTMPQFLARHVSVFWLGFNYPGSGALAYVR
jgi:hypothetical protein